MLDVQISTDHHFSPAIDPPLQYPRSRTFPSSIARRLAVDDAVVGASLPPAKDLTFHTEGCDRRLSFREQDFVSNTVNSFRSRMQQVHSNAPAVKVDYRGADNSFHRGSGHDPHERIRSVQNSHSNVPTTAHREYGPDFYQQSRMENIKPHNRSQHRLPSPHASQHNTLSRARVATEDPRSSKVNENAIHPYLQLPATISSTKGSLTEFAAQITCLFWFESSPTLSRIEDPRFSPLPRIALVPEASPSTGFLKWVTTILSTTQVTQNVILLALLFIHRLKKLNPVVKGKPGSEFRLFTVALMLGNKFLDDNTYTNKTWAEVSGISVTEIHVMEVEFLSHMKYNLFTSKEEWQQWHTELQHLWIYFNQAHSNHGNTGIKSGSLRPPALHIAPHLPSPPASTSTSPPYAVANSPRFGSFGDHSGSLSQLAPPQASPTSSATEFDQQYPSRKRSTGDSVYEPPTKRPHGYDPHQAPRGSLPPMVIPQTGNLPRLPTLPLPNLPIPSSQAASNHMPTNLTPTSTSRTPQNTLPPFNWNGPGAPSSSLPFPHTGINVNTSGHHERASRQHTPFSTTPTNPSPITQQFPLTAAHTTPHNLMSPSFFLNQRKSPYKPVRGISTLLVPPPSGQMHTEPQQVPYDQMHWHPLGKPIHERRTGRVPYLHREAWPDTDQVDQWPSAMLSEHLRR